MTQLQRIKELEKMMLTLNKKVTAHEKVIEAYKREHPAFIQVWNIDTQQYDWVSLHPIC